MDFIFQFIENNHGGLLIKSASVVEFFFCIYWYTTTFEKRKHIFIRALCFLVSIIFLICASAVIYTRANGFNANIINNIMVYSFHFIFLFVFFKETAAELLLCLCSGVATQIIVGRIFELLFILVGKDPYKSLSFFDETLLPGWLNWSIYYGFHIVLIYLLSRFFRKTEKNGIHDKATTRAIVFFSLTITIVTVPLSAYSRPFEYRDASLAMVIRITSILYGFLILFMRKGILERSRIKETLRIMDELLYSEKKQFESIKEEMELINIKCHDIRHQLTQYAGKLTDSELEELKSAIQIYDASLKTGNEILDIILYKKQPFCLQNNIKISCIADGKCLSFITPPHLYSLLNNAIENAIEAVMALENPEMRIISFTCSKENGITAIHLSNYFKGAVEIKDGIPQTSKSDTAHHGFGVKSMQYLVEQYGGQIIFETDDNIFYLNIYFPG